MREAIVDWLGFSFDMSTFEHWPDEPVELFKQWMGNAALGDEACAGRNSFRFTRNVYAFIEQEPVLLGFVSWDGVDHEGQTQGSQRGRANVQINGTGCAHVKDWSHIHEWMLCNSATITRCDVAVDFIEGEVTLDDALAMYLAGEFNWNNQPSYRQIGPWAGLSSDGRTLEIGKRKNGKMCRFYEKGKQLNLSSSPWVRCEVELHNKDRVVPLSIVIDPSTFFAGAYPCSPKLLDVEPTKISTSVQEYDVTVEAYTANLMRCYGKAITVLRNEHATDEQFLDAVAVPGVPKRLRKSRLIVVRGRQIDKLDDQLEYEQKYQQVAASDGENAEWTRNADGVLVRKVEKEQPAWEWGTKRQFRSAC